MTPPKPSNYRVDELLVAAAGIPEENLAIMASRYPGNPLVRDAYGRLRFSAAFLSYVASLWFPVEVIEAEDQGIKNRYETLLLADYVHSIQEALKDND